MNESRRSTLAELAIVIAQAIEAIDEPHAFRLFIQCADNLANEVGVQRFLLVEEEPATTGAEEWDTALAALAEYRLNADDLPIPQWVIERRGEPGLPWQPAGSDYYIPVDPDRVAPEFLSRGILIKRETLESA
jgi:hypothetical protein